MAQRRSTAKAKAANLKKLELPKEEMAALAVLIPEMSLDEDFDSEVQDELVVTPKKKRKTTTRRKSPSSKPSKDDLVPLSLDEDEEESTVSVPKGRKTDRERSSKEKPTLTKLTEEIDDLKDDLDSDSSDEEKLEEITDRLDEITEFLSEMGDDETDEEDEDDESDLEDEPDEDLDESDDLGDEESVNLISFNIFEMNEYRNMLGSVKFDGMPGKAYEDNVNCVFTGVINEDIDDNLDEEEAILTVLLDNQGTWESRSIPLNDIDWFYVFPEEGTPEISVTW